MTQRTFWRLAGLAGVAALLSLPGWAESSTAPRIRTGKPPAESPAGEEGEKLDPKVAAKLDQIMADQAKILEQLDQVMEELKIVKIRATVR